jgi:drug/metabolite transporter (DMT)-like permease
MTPASILYIFAAAVTAALLYVILRLFPQFKVCNIYALTINYAAASVTSIFAAGGFSEVNFSAGSGFLIPAFLIGTLFITVFYSAARCAQLCGVTVTSIAGKMSMVIPIVTAAFLFHDSFTPWKIAGIIIALAAVYFSAPGNETGAAAGKYWFLPLLVFAGSGLVDTSVKIAQHYYINESNQKLFISMLFASAGCIGLLSSILNYINKKIPLSLITIAAGIVLGITNYFSLYFLVKSLDAEGMQSSLVFSLVNLLVVMISAVIAITCFHEKTDQGRRAGLTLAVVAIILLCYR